MLKFKLYNCCSCFIYTEYPPNPKSRTQRMLVIKKGNTKDLQLSGFPVVGNLQSQPVKNGTGPSVYKGLVPKPAAPPTKVSSKLLNIRVISCYQLSYFGQKNIEKFTSKWGGYWWAADF